MISIDRILCPVHLPPEGDEALRYAVSLARAFKARLFLCHCEVVPVLTLTLPVSNREQQDRLLKESLVRYLGRPDSAALNWEVIVESGVNAGDGIVQEASRCSVDLIVTRSRRSPVAALLGSTAEQVSRTAPCPVVVVGNPEDGWELSATRDAEFKRILVSHDFSSSSELALSYALSIAEKYEAELHLLHVLPAPENDEPEIAPFRTGIGSVYQRVIRRLQDSVPEEMYDSRKMILAVRRGKPYREVLAYAREQDIDLISMGALGRDFGLEALFGSNVDRVIRQAPCPVLVGRPLKSATHVDCD